jgi:branched-chain amino acid transport system substrate-binding protein
MAGRFALLVGVSQYGVGFEPLPGSEKDLEQMAQVLGNPDLGGFAVERLLNPEPQRLREKIEEFFRNRSRDDVLLFYFSGHGALDDTGSRLYLSTCKTRKESQQLVQASAVEATLLREHLAKSNSQQKVVILDCCFSGAVANLLYNHKGESNAINLEPLKARGSVILASCEAYELSHQARESTAEDLAPSLYTRYLVEGIRTGAARTEDNEWIVARNLHEYAQHCFHTEQSASMQPRIVTLDREGYEIPVAKALRDVESEFTQLVAKRLEETDGKTEGLTNVYFEIERKGLGLSPESAKAIIDKQRIPYIIRQEKRDEYEAAFVVALEEGISPAERAVLKKIQVRLSLRDEDVLAIEAKYTKSLPSPIEVPVPPIVDSPPDMIVSGGFDGATTSEGFISQQPAPPPSSVDLLDPPLPLISDPPQRAWWRDRWRIIFGLILLVAGIPVSLQLCQQSPPPEKAAISPVANLQPAKTLISVGDNSGLYGSRSSKLSQEFRDRKADGIKAFKEKRYEEARDIFKTLRENARAIQDDQNQDQATKGNASNALKDPEVLIFQNNAQARLNSQTNRKPVLTIAVAAPLSNLDGEPLDIGQQLLFGVAQAQQKAIETDEINLEVVIANDLNFPAQAQALALELVKPVTGSDEIERPILAVIGHYSSPTTCAAVKTYSQEKLAVISPTATQPDLRKTCNGDTFFRTTSSLVIEAEALAQYLSNNSGIRNPKVAIFYNSKESSLGSYSKEISDSLQAALKSKGISTSAPIDLSTPGFNAQTELNQVSDANVLAVLPDGKVGDDKAFQNAVAVIEADNGKRLILGANPLADQGAITRGQGKQVTDSDPGRGLVIALDWFPGCRSADTFIERGKAIWGGEPNRIFALASEATQAVVYRLAQGKTTRQDILNDVGDSRAFPMSDVFQNQSISFLPNGDRLEIKSRILVTPLLSNEDDKQSTLTLAPGNSCSGQ